MSANSNELMSDIGMAVILKLTSTRRHDCLDESRIFAGWVVDRLEGNLASATRVNVIYDSTCINSLD